MINSNILIVRLKYFNSFCFDIFNTSYLIISIGIGL